MHRLHSFLTGVLLPNLSGLSIDSATASAEQLSLRRREVVEGVLWLHLGVDAGVFPEEPVRAFYDTSLRSFFDSLLSEDAEMRIGGVYVAHSDESQALVVELPRYAGIVVEKAMRNKDIFETELLGMSRPLALSGLCQTLLLLYSRFATSPTVRQFTYDVSFAPEEEWQEHWRAGCTPEETVGAEFMGSGPPIALAIARLPGSPGLRCKMPGRFENVRDRDDIPWDDVFRLRARLQEILQWRIDLRRTSGLERFERIHSKIAEEIEIEFATPGHPLRCSGADSEIH